MMKKGLILALALTLISVLTVAPALAADKKKIGVTVIVAHPALDADQEGFEQALADQGFGPDKVQYEYQNAQGEMSNAQTIAQKFANSNLDLVHSIATPTSQAAVKAIKNIPLVYSSVTDPVDAGLVPTMGPSGTNVTGVSDAWPIKRQLDMYLNILPDAKKWGTIYNAGDANSVKSIEWTREACEELGLELIEVTVSNSSEVYTAAQSLIGRVDAIYITSDNIVVSALESVVKVANDNDIPLFGGDIESCKRGYIAAYGLNYFQVGYTAGKKAALILSGEKKAGEVPSGPVEKLLLYVNLKAAEAQQVDVPQEIVDQADKIIK
jgi:putative ABC transport system substrate-binding protein